MKTILPLKGYLLFCLSICLPAQASTNMFLEEHEAYIQAFNFMHAGLTAGTLCVIAGVGITAPKSLRTYFNFLRYQERLKNGDFDNHWGLPNVEGFDQFPRKLKSQLEQMHRERQRENAHEEFAQRQQQEESRHFRAQEDANVENYRRDQFPELSPHATKGEIKRAYYAKSQQLHPDRSHGDQEAQQKLNEAYRVLERNAPDDPIAQPQASAPTGTDDVD